MRCNTEFLDRFNQLNPTQTPNVFIFTIKWYNYTNIQELCENKNKEIGLLQRVQK